MGFRISWLMFDATSAAEALSATGLNATDDLDEFNETPFSGAADARGYLLWVNDFDYATPERLAVLSQGRSVLGCQIHEGLMYSSARRFREGIEQWSIIHDAQTGARDLHASGTLPDTFAAVRERLTAQQDAADAEKEGVDFFFDIPLETAQSLSTFKHDTGHDGSLHFIALNGGIRERRSLLRRFFG